MAAETTTSTCSGESPQPVRTSSWPDDLDRLIPERCRGGRAIQADPVGTRVPCGVPFSLLPSVLARTSRTPVWHAVFSVEPIGHEYLPKYVMWISVGSHPPFEGWLATNGPYSSICLDHTMQGEMNCLQLSTCRRSLLAVRPHHDHRLHPNPMATDLSPRPGSRRQTACGIDDPVQGDAPGSFRGSQPEHQKSRGGRVACGRLE